jgi:hypothetical protein
MMLTIPISAIPNQQFSTVLAGQNCIINIYQKSTGVFLDLTVNENVICQGALVLGQSLIVKNTYLGFIGNLAIIDTQGFSDPDYTGFGDRYQLVYLEASDL